MRYFTTESDYFSQMCKSIFTGQLKNYAGNRAHGAGSNKRAEWRHDTQHNNALPLWWVTLC